MHWPSSIKQIQKLTEVEPLDNLKKPNNSHTYKPDPHDDEIIDLLTNYSNGLPYAILTYRSLYIFDWKHKVLVNVHIRSNESVENYGSNISVKLSPNLQTFAVLTDKNTILVYTVKLKTDTELFSTFNKEGKLLQNGYPITSYQEDPMIYGGIDSKYINNKDGQGQGIVKNILSSFIGSDDAEAPVFDFGLRLKLILNVVSPVVDYCFTNSIELMLINSQPHAFQVIHLANTDNKKSEKGQVLDGSSESIKFALSDEVKWFNDPEINGGSEIVGLDYNYDLACFLWWNEGGGLLLVRKRHDTKQLHLDATVVYKAIKGSAKVVSALTNHFRNTINILLDDGSILIYKLNTDLSCKLLKKIEAPSTSKNPKGIVLHPHGDSILVYYENGWNIYSVLGNLNFSTFEYDSMSISNCKKIQYLNAYELILVNKSNEIILIDLTVCNSGDGFNNLSMKRPLLCDGEKIWIFKAYEKKLIEHYHFNYNINDVTNKETDLWLAEMLPLKFKVKNTSIRSVSVNDDGNNVCVVGNYDVIVYSIVNRQWKYMEVIEQSAAFEKSESIINKCIWWKNYLILGAVSGTKQEKHSQVIIFSTKILEKKVPFSYDFVVWNFEFEETQYDEYFVNFNVDLHSDILFVMTNELNCYTWNLELTTNHVEKVRGDQQSSCISEDFLTSKKSSITLQRSTVYQLKSCFNENDESIILNFSTILRLSECGLLFLTNTDLYYIKKKRDLNTNSMTNVVYLINDSVEYVHKLNNSLVCLFDGSQLIHYNLSDDSDITKLKPIKISTGNENFSADNCVELKYIGVCSYPITTIPNQNIMFRIQVDCYNKVKLKLTTNRKNYLEDLINHYILSNMEVKKLEEDSNAMNITTVYAKFSKFKNFKFVMEKLLFHYLHNCYEDKNYDSNDDYFNRLYSLINLTGNPYEIILNCLKKTETHLWTIYFSKAKENPRFIFNKLFTENDSQRLTAHYFIIMMNYEYYGTKTNNKKSKKKNKGSKTDSYSLTSSDQDMVVNILKKLIISKDFETSFELIRFLKVIDQEMTHNCLEKMKKSLLKN